MQPRKLKPSRGPQLGGRSVGHHRCGRGCTVQPFRRQARLPVPSLHVVPSLIVPLVPIPNGVVDYWLFIPQDPGLVGYTLYTQAFSVAPGLGNVPLFASGVIGMTVQP